MVEIERRQRRPRRPRKTDTFVDMAYAVKPLEEAVAILPPGDLLSAIERKLAVEYGKFNSSWNPGNIEAEKPINGTARERVLNEMTRSLLDKVADVVVSAKPRELLGVTSDFWTGGAARKHPKPYVMLGNPRTLHGASTAVMISSIRRYQDLVENLQSELGVDSNSAPAIEKLTQEEEDRLLFVTKTSDPELGTLMVSNHVAYDDPKLVRVQRLPTILPGYVLQRATSEHPGLAVREVWSFSKVKSDPPIKVG